MKSLSILFVFLSVAVVCGQDDYGTDVVAASCSLSVKTTVLPSDSFDNTGRVRIVALLTDKNGAPILDQEIHVSANCGTFSCNPPAGEVDMDAEKQESGFCYNTGKDGKIKVYLMNIPFNKPGKVLATCSVGSFVPKASSTFIIKRALIKGKTVTKKKKQ